MIIMPNLRPNTIYRSDSFQSITDNIRYYIQLRIIKQPLRFLERKFKNSIFKTLI